MFFYVPTCLLLFSCLVVAKPFFLHTDACNTGLGAVLLQRESLGREIVVAFATYTLHIAEEVLDL